MKIDQIIFNFPQQSQEDWIYHYHEHDSLLENKPEEDLTEEDRKAAWEEFEREKRTGQRTQQPQFRQFDPAAAGAAGAAGGAWGGLGGMSNPYAVSLRYLKGIHSLYLLTFLGGMYRLVSAVITNNSSGLFALRLCNVHPSFH